MSKLDGQFHIRTHAVRFAENDFANMDLDDRLNRISEGLESNRISEGLESEPPIYDVVMVFFPEARGVDGFAYNCFVKLTEQYPQALFCCWTAYDFEDMARIMQAFHAGLLSRPYWQKNGIRRLFYNTLASDPQDWIIDLAPLYKQQGTGGNEWTTLCKELGIL